MMKNILLLVPTLGQGGIERVCAITARMLERKYRVFLAIFDTSDLFYDVSGIQVIDLNLPVKRSKLGKVINVWVRRHKVKKIKKEKEIDICLSFGSTASLINAISQNGDKTVAAIHGYGLLGEKFRMKIISRYVDEIVCCSKIITEDFIELYTPKRIETIYNPYQIDMIRQMSEEKIADEHREFFATNDKILVTMSRMDDVKGFWHLIKSFSVLSQKKPSVRLVLIGEGNFDEYIELAKCLHVDDQILFTGLLKNPFCYLRQCDIYVLTSIHEGLPNGVIEAMAVGLPIMAANCKSGPAEILHNDYEEASKQTEVYFADYGILLPQLNPNKNLNPEEIEQEELVYAQKLYDVLEDEKQLEKMRYQSLKRSEFFRAERYEERLVDILENL